MGSSEWDQLYLDCACNDNFDKVLKIKENDDLISDARSQMVELAVRNRAFLERASRPTKREMKLFELGQCREARASVVVDGVIHQVGSTSTLPRCLFFSLDFYARFFCVIFRVVRNGYPTQ